MRTPVAELAASASRLGLELDAAQLRAFERYAALLREWNARVNLTAITEPGEIATKHFLDSLTAIAARRWQAGERTVDVGSGAGFPGVPLAIALPRLLVTLVESVAKKVRFLETLIAELGLANVHVVNARAEELARDPAHRERHDVAVLRALPDLAANLELLLPFLRPGGDAIVFKGRVDDELDRARRAADALGGEIGEIVGTASLGLGATLPGRWLVVVRKVRSTPARFPRRTAEMKRKRW